MRILRLLLQTRGVKVSVLVVIVATAISTVYAALGDQTIVKDFVASKKWTALVPMDVDGQGPTDLISYNATTGRAVVSIGVGDKGEQKIVKDFVASKGWTAIVPMDVDCDPEGLTDLISYNATTGRAVVSIGVGHEGEQKIVKDFIASKGWTAIVPMDVDNIRPTDLISYNATTGRAVVSVADPVSDCPGPLLLKRAR